MGKWEMPRPNPLTDHNQNVAHVIMFHISTDMQNLITIPEVVSFPRVREIAHQRCLLGFFFTGSSNGPLPGP